MRILLLSTLAISVVGCARARPPADTDIDGLSRFLFQHWEDDRAVADGMTNLAVWLESTGRTPAATEEGMVLSSLTEDEVFDVEYDTEAPLDEIVGAVVAGSSPWSIERHAELLPLPDQTWNAPKNYERYDRSILEGSPDLFVEPDPDDDLPLLRTDNDVEQERVTIKVPYTLRKDYRWVQTRDGQRAIVGRTWAPRRGCSGSNPDEGGICLQLSFSVDLFYESPEGDTQRLTASWNMMSINFTEDRQVQMLVNGMIGVFEDTDLFLEERYPEGP